MIHSVKFSPKEMKPVEVADPPNAFGGVQESFEFKSRDSDNTSRVEGRFQELRVERGLDN